MNKYRRTIPRFPDGTSDVYHVLAAFGVKRHPVAHAIKKLLMPGQRGDKDEIQDLEEARDAIERAIEEARREGEKTEPDAEPKPKPHKPDDEGWIKHDGKVRPGFVYAWVKIKRRDGAIVKGLAHQMHPWVYDSKSSHPYDIVEYRITESKPEVDSDGWIKHDGRSVPHVGPKRVKVRQLNGVERTGVVGDFYKSQWEWRNINTPPTGLDIVDYCVLED